MRPLRLASALCLALALAACGDPVGSADDEMVVVATTSILGDIASHVVGDEGRVEVLIPNGVDAHDFAPSAQQAGSMATADLVLANGLGLEAGLTDVLDAAADDGTNIVEVAPLVEPLTLGSGGDGLDPHFWMDPIRAGEAAVVLGEELARLHPEGGWQARATEYLLEMEEVDAGIDDILSAVTGDRRKMVTNHHAFGYFADRYGFEIVGVIIPGGSTLAEPSSAELAQLVAVMKRAGTGVIFAETSQPTTIADAVAAELGTGVEVVELFTEALGEPSSGAGTLSGMLLTNAERIAAALA
ncbi:MAG: metal ABC transporter solute-binding protein, Zn/Mn family [Acidimicrobiia bacterium]